MKSPLFFGLTILALVDALASCQETGEDTSQVATGTPSSSSSYTATPRALRESPLPSVSVIVPTPTPQVSPGQLAMEGPKTAMPGEILTYRLTYTFPDRRGSGIIIAIPRSTQYVSSQLVTGEGEVTKEPDSETIDLRWLLIGTGVLEVTVRVPVATVSGTVVMGASGPGGSGIPPEEQMASNIATTVISSP